MPVSQYTTFMYPSTAPMSIRIQHPTVLEYSRVLYWVVMRQPSHSGCGAGSFC